MTANDRKATTGNVYAPPDAYDFSAEPNSAQPAPPPAEFVEPQRAALAGVDGGEGVGTGERKSRIIVLLFDGTTNTFSGETTNVMKLAGLLDPDARNQAVYYQSGIGTAAPSVAPNPLLRSVLGQPVVNRMRLAGHALGQLYDAAVAVTVDDHIMKGYEFLMNQYLPGDKIFIFGFSRGAYIARALVGMLERVNLLPPGNAELIPLAFNRYRPLEEAKHSCEVKGESATVGDYFTAHVADKEFVLPMSLPVRIAFLGVWDTVSSVGGLDERRVDYLPELVRENECHPWNVKQVYFSGSHSDVGGGSSASTSDISLSNLSLRWMIKEGRAEGLLFDTDRLLWSPIYRNIVGDAVERYGDIQDDTKFSPYVQAVLEREPNAVRTVLETICTGSTPSGRAREDAFAPRTDALVISSPGSGIDIEEEQGQQQQRDTAFSDWTSLKLGEVREQVSAAAGRLRAAPLPLFWSTRSWVPPNVVYKSGSILPWPLAPNGLRTLTSASEPNSKPSLHWSVRERMQASGLAGELEAGYRPAATIDGKRLTIQTADGVVEWVDQSSGVEEQVEGTREGDGEAGEPFVEVVGGGSVHEEAGGEAEEEVEEIKVEEVVGEKGDGRR
ncbi:hypothetical protein JCM8547_000760 [Rhodosporidiobolus lusitaniae]